MTEATITDGPKAILTPRSIAVLGASEDQSKFGGRLVHNLTRHGFPGNLHFVRRNTESVMGQTSYKSVLDIDTPVDVAIMAIPAAAVPAAVEECAAAKVSAAVIISTGFSELGAEGSLLEDRLRETARTSRVRLLGPNCLGAVNPHHALALTSSVSMAAGPLISGSVGLVSQSGAMMVSLSDWLRARGRGFSAAVSLGNQLDLEVTDFLEFFAQDPNTEAICAYVEGLRKPERFVPALRQCAAAGKPVIIVKAGRTSRGTESVAAHTASFAGSYEVFRAACEEAGARVADDPIHMIALAEALAVSGKAPPASLAIISTSGGANAIMTDAAVEGGVELAVLQDRTCARLKEDLYPQQAQNPVDLGASLSTLDPVAAARSVATTLSEDAAVGMILLAITSAPNLKEITRAVVDGVRASEKPLFGLSFVGEVGDDAHRVLRDAGIVCFERIGDALGYVTALHRRLPIDSLSGAMPRPDMERFAGFGPTLNEEAAKRLLKEAGISCNAGELVVSEKDAVKAAQRLGYPVVMKVSSSAVVHKTDAGGVVLDISDEASARIAWRTLGKRFGSSTDDYAVFVQEQVKGKIELLVGARFDEQFGPVIVAGAGGTFVHVFDDVQLRLAPVSIAQAESMLRGLRMWPILAGERGQRAIDISATARTISKLSEIAVILGDRLRELEINPLMIDDRSGQPIAVDARGSLR